MDHLNKLIFLFFLCFFTTSAYSSAQLSVDFKATNFQQLLKTDSGLLSSVKYTAQNNAGRAVYGLRTASLSKSIVGSVLKNRSFSPWGVAIVVAIEAAGYFLNDATGEIEQVQSGGGQYSTTLGDCIVPQVSSYTNRTLQECIDLQTKTYIETVFLTGGIFSLILDSAFKGSWNIPDPPPSQNPDDYISTPAVNATDDEVYDAVVPSFSESDLSNALNDPDTGQPDTDLTPLVDTANDLTSDYDALNDNDPNTEPTTDNLYDTGDETFTENVDELPNDDIQNANNEQTDQCELTPDALGCQEFGDELTSVEIPVEQVSFSFTPVSLASNMTCPEPIMMNLSFGQIPLSYQPTCDFMSAVSPVVILVCTLLSVYIITGGVRG